MALPIRRDGGPQPARRHPNPSHHRPGRCRWRRGVVPRQRARCGDREGPRTKDPSRAPDRERHLPDQAAEGAPRKSAERRGAVPPFRGRAHPRAHPSEHGRRRAPCFRPAGW